MSRPARLPLVADQVSPAVTLAANGEAGFFPYFLRITPRSGPHRRPERVGSAFSDNCGRIVTTGRAGTR